MKKIKDSIARILYKLIVFIVKLLPAKKGQKHLLIIKLDEIGDYVLFRNLLKYFKQSERYRDYKITFLGNAAWKPIFDEYDALTVDEAIWITKKRFNKDLLYRFSLLRKIRLLKTSDVVNCVFSRSIILDDGFAIVAKCNSKTAMKGEEKNANAGKYAIKIDRLIYNKIIDAGDARIFDTIRDCNYLSVVLGCQLPKSIQMSVHDHGIYTFENYCVVFIGPGNKIERKWPVENFVKCAQHVYSAYGYNTIICGGPTDEADAARFMQLYQGPAVNLAGKTTLPGFIELLSKSKFLLSVDNGPVHIAAAAGCPVVGLYSGVHYGRYAPYPKEVAPFFHSVYPDSVDELVSKGSDDLHNPFIMKNEAIRTIGFEKVVKHIDALLREISQ